VWGKERRKTRKKEGTQSKETFTTRKKKGRGRAAMSGGGRLMKKEKRTQAESFWGENGGQGKKFKHIDIGLSERNKA